MTTELTLLSDVVCRGVPVGGARLRGLLALLAGRLGPGCGTGALVDALWPDDPPRHPVKALQILVSRARAELGADLIVRTATGYRLALTDAQVDVAAVLRHAAAAARHARAGRRGAPFGPSRAKTVASGTRRSTPSSTTCLRYALRSPDTSTIAPGEFVVVMPATVTAGGISAVSRRFHAAESPVDRSVQGPRD
ncbi:hypothetical protein ABZX66_15635 [Micromonospora aurantiaca]|uniref:AfsR/SARP family transcriptional regulator n=1 Tax=Micromonospora aurantiaca (nom. illeg.) TaxID=47850 RepID=UPI0033B94BB0